MNTIFAENAAFLAPSCSPRKHSTKHNTHLLLHQTQSHSAQKSFAKLVRHSHDVKTILNDSELRHETSCQCPCTYRGGEQSVTY